MVCAGNRVWLCSGGIIRTRVKLFGRNHLRRGYGGQEERKGRKDLNREIHGIHENGRPHRDPLSSVLRRLSFLLLMTNFSRVERVERVEVLDRINMINRITELP